MNRLKVESLRMFIALVTNASAMIMLLCCANGNPVLAQKPNRRAAEGSVEQEIRKGQEVDAKGGEIGADFLSNLLETYRPPTSKPSSGIVVRHAKISGALSFKSKTILYDVKLENCEFNDDLDFTGSDFQKGLSLRGSTFHGRAIFYQMSVGGELRVNKAHFASGKDINFDTINVNGTVQLYQTKFAGPFTLTNSEMQTLECTQAEFGNDADFYLVKVNGDASFTESSFNGMVNFESINIAKNFELTGVRFNDPSKTIGFSSMRVGGHAVLNRTEFMGGFDLSQATVDGMLALNQTQARNTSATKNFSEMKVGTAVFDNAALTPPYHFGGADYGVLSVRSGGRDASLDLIEASTYSRENYTKLEAFYRRKALEDEADNVYVAGEARERDEKFSQQGMVNFPGYVGSWILYFIAGYGKRKELALVWSLALIGVGYFVFRKEEYMEVQKAEDASRYKGRYHPLWYSIALFLPIVALEDAKIWAPRIMRRKSRFYMRLHIILGYLLIPIGLAAWAGLIK